MERSRCLTLLLSFFCCFFDLSFYLFFRFAFLFVFFFVFLLFFICLKNPNNSPLILVPAERSDDGSKISGFGPILIKTKQNFVNYNVCVAAAFMLLPHLCCFRVCVAAACSIFRLHPLIFIEFRSLREREHSYLIVSACIVLACSSVCCRQQPHSAARAAPFSEKLK